MPETNTPPPYIRRIFPIFQNRMKVFFKSLENLQNGGAFKARGAITAINSLNAEERARGVTTHSSGNHAAAVALMAQRCGIRAHIVMPSNTPQSKQRICKAANAETYFCEPTLQSREAKQQEVIAQTGAHFIHPFDDYRVITGQASVALECFAEKQGVDYFLTPVSGGGLLSGCALVAHYMSPTTKVIGVEPYLARDAFLCFQENRLVAQLPPLTIADGLRMPLKERTWNIIREHVAEILLVSEREIVEAVNYIQRELRIVVEPSGAVTLAAVLRNKDKFRGKRTVCVFSGGNIDHDYSPKLADEN